METQQLKNDTLTKAENSLNADLMALDKEIELLEESYDVLKRPIDSGNVPNMRNVKLFIRKRAEEFRNQIKLCMSILERILDNTDNPDSVRQLIVKLEKELEAENDTLSEIESMYESEVKCGLQLCEKTWQLHHAKRYEEVKDLLNSERENLMKRQMDSPPTYKDVVDYSDEKFNKIQQQDSAHLAHVQLQKSMALSPRPIIHQAGEESKDFPLYSSSHEATYVRSSNQTDKPHRDNLTANHNCDESDNNLSPRCYNANNCNDINQESNSFNNLNMDNWQNDLHPTQRNLDSMRQNAQRSMQVVTSETELNRPRFGRKHIEFNNENFQPNNDESDNNYGNQHSNDLDQASNTFNNLNLDEKQNNAQLSQRDRESELQNAQRTYQVVTEETEANRPRFGRKNTAWMD